MTASPDPLLRTSGPRITDGLGNEVRLRGVLIAGWLNMENYISGFPGYEEGLREAARRKLGAELSDHFFNAFLCAFYTEADAAYLSSVGVNLIRIALNYRHLEDDSQPFVIKETGFAELDRAIACSAAHGIYTVIDLHALPGYQNGDWHTDNPTHKALLWRHPHFQDRTVNLWRAIAKRYRRNPWVAGYNPINEPDEPNATDTIVALSGRLVEAIREEDPEHIIFIEGTDYSRSFDAFTEAWPGTVYSVHDYSRAGLATSGPYPGLSAGVNVDLSTLNETFLERSKFMRDRGLPIWVAEVGAVFNGPHDHDRYQLIDDQLSIYEGSGASWSLCTYKDIGVMALRTVDAGSAYLVHFRDLLAKKARLGVDPWTATNAALPELTEMLTSTLAREFPVWSSQHYGRWSRDRLLRGVLLSEPMMQEWADRLEGLDRQGLERLAGSFSFDQTHPRRELEEIIMRHSKGAV